MNTEHSRTLQRDSSHPPLSPIHLKSLDPNQLKPSEGPVEERDSALRCLQSAQLYLTNGRWLADPFQFDKAEELLEKVDRLLEKEADEGLQRSTAFLRAGLLLERKRFGELEACLKDLEAACEGCGSGLAQVRLLRAEACLAREDLEGAKAEAQAALSLLEGHLPEHPRLAGGISKVLASAYLKGEQTERAEAQARRLLDWSRLSQDPEYELIALQTLAVISSKREDFENAMGFLFDALEKAEALGHVRHVAQAQINLGTLHAHLHNFEEAIRRYEFVLQQFDHQLEPHTRAILQNNLGSLRLQEEQPQEAAEWFCKAWELAQEAKLNDLLPFLAAQRCRAEIECHRWEEAQDWADRCEAHLSLGGGQCPGRSIHLLNLACLHLHRKQLEEALRLAKAGLAAARENHDEPSQKRAHQLLSRIYELKEDFPSALDHYKQLSHLQAATLKRQRENRCRELTIRQSIRDKQKEIERLTRENQFHRLMLEKNEQLAKQNEELSAANNELRQFAYIVSHDLKEPLRMIASCTQLIERQAKPLLDEQFLTFFQYISEGVQRMNALLDALLRYATVSNSEMEVAEVDLHGVLRQCLLNLKVSMERHNAQVEAGPLPVVRGNALFLGLVFQNLLENAFQFRHPERPPRVYIHSRFWAGEYLIFVQDNGAGIPEEHRERIFGFFKRLHHYGEKEGMGMGLSICQKIIHRHGGRIWVDQSSPEGTTIAFALPAPAKDAPAEPS